MGGELPVWNPRLDWMGRGLLELFQFQPLPWVVPDCSKPHPLSSSRDGEFPAMSIQVWGRNVGRQGGTGR